MSRWKDLIVLSCPYPYCQLQLHYHSASLTLLRCLLVWLPWSCSARVSVNNSRAL